MGGAACASSEGWTARQRDTRVVAAAGHGSVWRVRLASRRGVTTRRLLHGPVEPEDSAAGRR